MNCMNNDILFQIDSKSAETTETIAAAIGARMRGGEVIALISDLGGGKTAFVRGLANGMGSADHVSSPTFTISRQYNASSLKLYHYDFYRLQEAGILSLELTEVLEDPFAVVAVEWGEIVKGVLPEDLLTVNIIRTGETRRHISLGAPEKYRYMFDGLEI